MVWYGYKSRNSDEIYLYNIPPSLELVGTENDDVLSGNERGDIITGLEGNDSIEGLGGGDSIRGGEGNDSIYGGQDEDSLMGGTGRDRLIGGLGNDTLNGGAGSDTPIGVNPRSAGDGVGFGAGEVDNYRGGAGNDTFVLGDAERVYYDDGNPLTTREHDYALLVDFNPDEDVIRVFGSADLYGLDFYTADSGEINAILSYDPGASDREAIAVLLKVPETLSLTDPAFAYV